MKVVQEQKAYLSVVEWPESFDFFDCVEALVGATGMDPFAADQAVKRGVPQVVTRIPAEQARRALDHLHTVGVTAFAPTTDQMRSGEPARIKSLATAVGAPEPMFLCELWTGGQVGLRLGDVFLFVRARTTRSDRQTEARSDGRRTATGYMIAGVEGALIAGALAGEGDVERSIRSKPTEIMDIYLRDGQRLRLDADKLSFEVLGADRGYSDLDNMNRLAVLLAEGAPRALVDTGFKAFRCPADIATTHSTGSGGVRRHRVDDRPVFEFYTVWVHLLYRHLLAS